MTNKVLKKYNSLSIQIKAGIWFFICSMIQKGISSITTPVFTRLMSTEQYGIYTVYQTWRDILSILITFGLSSSVYMKKMVDLDTQEEKDKLTCSLQGLATLTTTIALIIYLPFRAFWNSLLKLPTGIVLTIFISVLLTTAFEFWAARARINFKYRALVAVTLLTSLMKPIIAIIAITQTTETAAARIYSVTGVEVLVFSVIYVINFRSRQSWYHKGYWKYAMIFVLPLIPHFLSQRILSSSDRIMIESMVGKSETGIYGLANSIGAILSIVVTSCDGVLAPWVYSNIKANCTGQIRKISMYVVGMMAVLSFGIIVIAPELTRIFAPPEYYEAIWTLPPLIMSVFFMMIYVFFIYFEYYFEETKQIMVATMASAALNIGLNYIFIRWFGYVAAGYTTLFCYLAYTIFHCIVYMRTCKKKGIEDPPYNLKLFALISILLLLLGFSVMALYNSTVIRYLIVLLIVSAVFIKRRKIVEIVQQIKNEKRAKV